MGNTVINDDFTSSLNNWNNATLNTGRAVVTTSLLYGAATKTFVTIPGQVYRVTYSTTVPSGAVIEAEVYADPPAAGYFLVNKAAVAGTNQVIFMASSAQSLLRIQKANAPGTSITYSIDNVVVDQPSGYKADIVSNTDYYPFGQTMPGRKWVGGDRYKYGFNGKEQDDEVKGNGNSLDFGARIYDPRLGRWLSVDPKSKLYPDNSPYHFGYNNPIYYKDVDGGVISGVTKEDFEIIYASVIKLFSSAKLNKQIFQRGADNMHFAWISPKEFEYAISGLNEKTKALANGYYQAIISEYNYQVKIVDNSTDLGDNFKNEVLDNTIKDENGNTAQDRFLIKTGADLDDMHLEGRDKNRYRGAYATTNGINKSLLIINQQFINNKDKILYTSSNAEHSRNFEGAFTNAIFGEFYLKDNFIKRKPLNNDNTVEYKTFRLIKTQSENLVRDLLRLNLFSGMPHYHNFSTFEGEFIDAIPEELKVETGGRNAGPGDGQPYEYEETGEFCPQ